MNVILLKSHDQWLDAQRVGPAIAGLSTSARPAFPARGHPAGWTAGGQLGTGRIEAIDARLS